MTSTQKENQSVKKLARSLGCSIWPKFGPNGSCPVQAEGRIALPNRKPVAYYFRARGTKFNMGFHLLNPVFSSESFNIERKLAEEHSAGWVAKEKALEFMKFAITSWKNADVKTKLTHG